MCGERQALPIISARGKRVTDLYALSVVRHPARLECGPVTSKPPVTEVTGDISRVRSQRSQAPGAFGRLGVGATEPGEGRELGPVGSWEGVRPDEGGGIGRLPE